jgi:aryl-alcohol dehydrogenase-like predicted oxidoreductase
MEYGQIPGLDRQVSRLIHGAISLSMDDLEGGFALLDAAMDHGINTFDTAHLYGGGAVDGATAIASSSSARAPTTMPIAGG